MRESRNPSLWLLIALIIACVETVIIKGQSLNYVIQGDSVITVNEVIQPVRSVNSIDENTIEITYSIRSFSTSEIKADNENYQLIRIPGFGLSLHTGDPALPTRTEKIAVPPGYEPVVSIKSSEFTDLRGYHIYPAQELSTDEAPEKPEFKKNTQFYERNQLGPVKVVDLAEIQVYRDIPVAYIRINPLQYNPFRRKIRLYKSLVVRIEFKPSTGYTSPKSNRFSTGNYDLLNNSVVNQDIYYNKITQAKNAQTSPKGYMIITTPEFEPAANVFAGWKRQLGYKVDIVTQQYWATYQVKSVVQSKYDNGDPPPSYLLIIGDHDDVPAEKKTYENKSWYLSIYYTCMDGPNDKLPDIALGRIPANNLNEAMTVVNKIIDYEKNPTTDPGFYRHALHCTYFEQSPGATGVSDKRYTHTTEESREYMIGQGFDITRVYTTENYVNPQYYSQWYSGGGPVHAELLRSNGFAWDGNRYDIIYGINRGALYVFHRDHGLIDGWRDPAINNADVAAMNNGNKLPFVFSVNCHSGNFQVTHTKCLAEVLLQKENGGAVGVVAATEETYSGYNDAMIEGFLDAIWPDPGLIPVFGTSNEAVQNPNITPHVPIYTIGDVYNQGLLRMTETWDGWARERQYERYHYFGDPATRIWTDIPVEISAAHTSVGIGAKSIEIFNSNCPAGLATVCINNELKGIIQLTGGKGILTWNEAVDVNDEVILTISAHNFRPYQKVLSVSNDPVTNNTLKILPLGNSLTFDQYLNDTRSDTVKAGYRIYLAELLAGCNIQYDFVGSEISGDKVMNDAEHGGFPGMTASQLLHLLRTGYNQLDYIQETPGYYLDAFMPELILLHIGTNGFTTDVSIIDSILTEIDQYKIRNGKDTKVILAKIMNQAPFDPDISAFNSNLEQLVISRSDSSLFLVDMEMESGIVYEIEPLGDMKDKYHPISSGYQKMAQIWMEGISMAIKKTPDIPQFINTNNVSLELGDPVYIDFLALASEKPTYTLLNSLPGMEFDETLGILEWTPDMPGVTNVHVRAMNGFGSSSAYPSISVVKTMIPPQSPLNISVQWSSDSIISIAWTDMSDNETGFEVERSINGGNFIKVKGLSKNTDSTTDYLTQFNVSYIYRVRAENDYGKSEFVTSSSVFVSTGTTSEIAGYDEVYPYQTYKDYRSAQLVSMPETGTIQKIAMYHGAGAGNLIYAIYNDASGEPGNLLGKTAITPVNTSQGWQEVELVSPVTLNANDAFWISWVYQYIPELRYSNNGPGRATSNQKYPAGMPDNYGSSEVANYRYSIHAMYQPVAPNPVPAAPSSLSWVFSQTNTSVILHWIDNSNDESGFVIERSTNSEPFEIIGSVPSNVTSFVDSSIGLNNNYIYRIYATNSAGNSAVSEGINVNTVILLPEPPVVPQNISIQLSGIVEIEINWDDASNNEDGFRIERSIDDSAYTLVALVSANSTHYTDYDTRVNASHRYRIKAFNTYGESDYVTSTYLFIPEIGENKEAGNHEVYPYQSYREYRCAQLVFMPEEGIIESISMYHGAGSGSLIYAIYEDAGGMPGVLLGKTSATQVNSVAGWQDVDLETPVNIAANSSFWIAWVYEYIPELRYSNNGPGRATSSQKYSNGMPDEFGISQVANFRYSVYATYKPVVVNQVPAAPSALTANYNETIPLVSLSWSDNSGNEGDFVVERSTNSDPFTIIGYAVANATTFDDTNIEFNMLYAYRVYAMNANGNSSFTNTVSISTNYIPPGPPMEPTELIAAYNAGVPSISLSWIDNSNDEDEFILERKIDSGPYTEYMILSPDQTDFIDNEISYSTEYSYRIFASNTYGNSNSSNVVTNFSTEPASDPIVVGFEDIFPMSVVSPYRRAQPVTVPEDGIIESISMYFNPHTPGNFLYGVYSDNAGYPDNLLAVTPLMPKGSNTGWHAVELTTPLEVSSGEIVWLAWIFESGAELFYDYGTPGRAHNGDTWSGSLPSVFGSAMLYDYIYSIYMTLVPFSGKEAEFKDESYQPSAQNISIFPNPVDGNTVKFIMNNIKKADFQTIEIVDITGNILEKKMIWVEPGIEYEIQLANSLRTGLFIIRIRNDENTHVEKIILNN